MNDEVVEEIKRRALLFVVDNPHFSHIRTEIEAAMMIGASIVFEQEAKENEKFLKEARETKDDELLVKIFPDCLN